MSRHEDLRREIEQRARAVEEELLDHVEARGRLGIVQAPPGSGKTWLLLRAVARARELNMRVAVATQTNSQADDICRRFARDYPNVHVIRFAAKGTSGTDLGKSIQWETDAGQLPHSPCVVVGTTAKWGLVTIVDPYDFLFVEEAWQMAWSDFMLLGQVAARFVLIGDPGQIPPVVTIGVERWETSPRAPHRAAPELILADAQLKPEVWSLPATRRLPHDSAGLVRPFYDFEFGAFAAPGERVVRAKQGGGTARDRLIDLLNESTSVGLTIPTPDGGPPLEEDEELAGEAAKLVSRLLSRESSFRIDGRFQRLEPRHIGLCATHRVMNSALDLALPTRLRGHVVVDTPERWQGLERPVMIVVHPLSGVLKPSTFDLETGRLCVMASRHQAGLIIVARDHLNDTLEACIPMADQAVGRPDITGRGLRDNLQFWSALESTGRAISA